MVKENSLVKRIKKFRGYKFYQDIGNGQFDIVRFIGNVKKINSKEAELTVINEFGYEINMLYSKFKEKYTPLNPDGIISFNIVDVSTKDGMMQDVMVLGYKNVELAIGVQDPYFICRQSINDFFADLEFIDPEDNHFVGVSVTRDNCPVNVDFMKLLACSGIRRSDVISYYRDDTIEDILKCVPVEKYNKVLEKLYQEHSKLVKDPIRVATAKEIDGWCRDLSLLLKINNVMADFNYMNNIIGIDFNLEDFLENRENGVKQLDKAARLFFSETIKCNIKESRVIEYNYSVDMSKFNNDNYILIRDKSNKVYLIVYLSEGEYLEEELQKEINKLDVTQTLQLAYYDKYNKR